MLDINNVNIKKAAEIIKNAKHVTAFTGAGISVESGIPSFRGEDGLWSKYDINVLELNYFKNNPVKSWQTIREIFYEHFGKANPNPAHLALAELEQKGKLKAIITQNIDSLHQKAGNTNIFEFHGTADDLICTECGTKYNKEVISLKELPPKCKKCEGVLKPDFIFFGEGIPQEAYHNSFKQATIADVFILIGTTGLVAPASQIPQNAKENGATIIEINIKNSAYSKSITDIMIKGKAGEVLPEILKYINEE